MSEVIVITLGKGGAGKATISTNIGTGLALLGIWVVLIDAGIGLHNLDVITGLGNRIIYNLVDIVEGNYRMKQALIRGRRYPDLHLPPSAQTRDKSVVNPGRIIKLVDDLKDDFDYILLGCPAGIGQGFRNVIAGTDKALVVTTPEVSAIRDTDRIIGLLGPMGIGQIEFIVSRVHMDMMKRGDMISIDGVMDILAIPMLGAIPSDETVVIPVNQGEPLTGMSSPSGQAYLDTCKRPLGEKIPLIGPDTSHGIFSRLSLLLRQT